MEQVFAGYPNFRGGKSRIPELRFSSHGASFPDEVEVEGRLLHVRKGGDCANVYRLGISGVPWMSGKQKGEHVPFILNGRSIRPLHQRPETEQERVERILREESEKRAAILAKLAAAENKVRKQREALERQPGNKYEGARREKLACKWLLGEGFTKSKRTSPRAPGYDIDAINSVGVAWQFEVKPKGETLTEPEHRFALAHQDTWRLIEYNPKTQTFKMYTYAQCVWKEKLVKRYKFYPVAA